MINFGYKIQTDRQIDYDAGNHRIFDFVRAGEPSIDWCMSCGTCASGCTAAVSTEYSLRRLIILARRGMENEIIDIGIPLPVLWKMHKCLSPGVNTRNIVYLMQLAVTKISKP